jgi:hypothetical protein
MNRAIVPQFPEDWPLNLIATPLDSLWSLSSRGMEIGTWICKLKRGSLLPATSRTLCVWDRTVLMWGDRKCWRSGWRSNAERAKIMKRKRKQYMEYSRVLFVDVSGHCERFMPLWPMFNPRPINVELMSEKASVGQILPQCFRSTCPCSFSKMVVSSSLSSGACTVDHLRPKF